MKYTKEDQMFIQKENQKGNGRSKIKRGGNNLIRTKSCASLTIRDQ